MTVDDARPGFRAYARSTEINPIAKGGDQWHRIPDTASNDCPAFKGHTNPLSLAMLPIRYASQERSVVPVKSFFSSAFLTINRSRSGNTLNRYGGPNHVSVRLIRLSPNVHSRSEHV
jgi:hypothetical protein